MLLFCFLNSKCSQHRTLLWLFLTFTYKCCEDCQTPQLNLLSTLQHCSLTNMWFSAKLHSVFLLLFIDFFFLVYLSLHLLLHLVSSRLILLLHQVPSQFYGWCQRWFHERKSPQWHAHSHPAQKVHGAHQDHLSTSQEAQTGVASSHGGRRRLGQQAGGSWSCRSSVSGVRLDFEPKVIGTAFDLIASFCDL